MVLERSEIPGGVLVAGTPAKIKKELSARALEWTELGINSYLQMQACYRAQGIDKEWKLINLPFSVRGTCPYKKADELKLAFNAIALAQK